MARACAHILSRALRCVAAIVRVCTCLSVVACVKIKRNNAMHKLLNNNTSEAFRFREKRARWDLSRPNLKGFKIGNLFSSRFS